MKLFDVMQSAGGPDVLRQIEAATRAFNFERDLLEKCKRSKLSHVAVPIEDGQIQRPPALPLFYLIFEAADGDMRRVLRAKQKLDKAWLIRCMHGICVGIAQLHSIDIAHQDLKPSNVLISGSRATVADLGRACDRGVPADHDKAWHAGDINYAPPELLYNHLSPDWDTRRRACDLFHIGSMMTYMTNGANMTALMLSNVSAAYRPNSYKGLYRDVAVHLRHALEDSLNMLGTWWAGSDGRELVDMIRCFCDPEPETRLNLVAGGRSGPALEWHISRLDYLSRKAGMGLLKMTEKEYE